MLEFLEQLRLGNGKRLNMQFTVSEMYKVDRLAFLEITTMFIKTPKVAACSLVFRFAEMVFVCSKTSKYVSIVCVELAKA